MLFIAVMLFTLSGCSTYSSSSGYSSTSHGNIRQSTSYYSPYDRAYYSSYSPYTSYAPRRAYAFPYSNVGRYSRHGFNRYAYRSPQYYTTTRPSRNYGNRHNKRHHKRHHRKHHGYNNRSYNNNRSHRNHRHHSKKRHHKRINRDRQRLLKTYSNSSIRKRFK